MHKKAESGRQYQLTFNKTSGATKPVAPGLSYAVFLLQLPFIHTAVLCPEMVDF